MFWKDTTGCFLILYHHHHHPHHHHQGDHIFIENAFVRFQLCISLQMLSYFKMAELLKKRSKMTSEKGKICQNSILEMMIALLNCQRVIGKAENAKTGLVFYPPHCWQYWPYSVDIFWKDRAECFLILHHHHHYHQDYHICDTIGFVRFLLCISPRMPSYFKMA